MRVAISAEGNQGLDSTVSPHFSRCPYYVLVDLDGAQVKQVEVVNNPAYRRHQPEQMHRFIKDQQADAMLAGGMGQRAIALLNRHGIEAVTGASGTAQQALTQYLEGTLRGAAPCREPVGRVRQEPADGEGENATTGARWTTPCGRTIRKS